MQLCAERRSAAEQSGGVAFAVVVLAARLERMLRRWRARRERRGREPSRAWADGGVALVVVSVVLRSARVSGVGARGSRQREARSAWAGCGCRAGTRTATGLHPSIEQSAGPRPGPRCTPCHTPCGLTGCATLPRGRGPGDCAPPRSGPPTRRSLVGERRTVDRDLQFPRTVGRRRIAVSPRLAGSLRYRSRRRRWRSCP